MDVDGPDIGRYFPDLSALMAGDGPRGAASDGKVVDLFGSDFARFNLQGADATASETGGSKGSGEGVTLTDILPELLQILQAVLSILQKLQATGDAAGEGTTPPTGASGGSSDAGGSGGANSGGGTSAGGGTASGGGATAGGDPAAGGTTTADGGVNGDTGDAGSGIDTQSPVAGAASNFDSILAATRALNDQLIQQKFDAAVEQNITAGEQAAVDAVKKN